MRPFMMALLAVCLLSPQNGFANEYDLVIYGGTSGGVAAAIQAARMNRRVVLIEPGEHLGGLTSGGLGATDIGNKAAIGGISREFYQRVKRHYARREAWNWEQSSDYVNRRQGPNEDAMWFFEPSVAEQIYDSWISEYPIEVVREERLNRETGVRTQAGRILSIEMESGRTFAGRIFIDATYEGDLLAAAGVQYIVGREANSEYDETLNGVQTENAVKHQLYPGVDPYVRAGDPSSGLLPGIDPKGPGMEGAGDHRVQAYCFRMCVTDVKENQIPFTKPPGYDPQEYELLLRNFEAGEKVAPWHPLMMPNRKTDANNNRGVSTDYIGMNYDWAEATYETREEIYQKHLAYQQGLMWTLANHPRVPDEIRRSVSRWGKCKDEFQANGGWSHQLYVREARRMIGSQVMTQHHCQGRDVATAPIGLAAYTMDSHNVQRYVDNSGQVRNEGDVQVGGFPPYPIAYGSILPKREQCQNLLVPVCLSASHIAYGSIRMEPVFMVLGQSAATAACLSLDQDISLHDLPYPALEKQLQKDQQVLSWTEPEVAAGGIDPEGLQGLVLDDHQAEFKGAWSASQSTPGFVGRRYRHDGNQQDGRASATFRFKKVPAGRYDVRLAYTSHGNRATNVPVSIVVNGKADALVVNQRKKPAIEGSFESLAVVMSERETEVVVSIRNQDTDGYVIADAVWLAPVK